ncbi:tumor necrosis factor b (TNF superfamily, member 2) [Denticeps clupeoides]|uniref:Lymphotoxin-alpha n=1 Tax=Denticeps clupeoides TaxID=299321 RepID=A0AAY4EMC0_9TELE|nr:tumor necrosis factor-like [Denticeps clupeoides]
MVEYKMTPLDVETGLRQATQVAVLREKRSCSWVWKVVVMVLLAAVCSLFLAWYMQQRQEGEHGQNQRWKEELEDLTHREHKQSLKQIAGKANAAMHLEGHKEGESLEWKSGINNAFYQGGLSLKENKIIIPETGIYFIYSQASFAVRCSKAAVQENPTLVHTIRRFSNMIGEPTTLLSGDRSACLALSESKVDDGQRSYSGIYLGAVFQLQQGDELWTESIGLESLEDDHGKTFFGVFAL